MTFDDQLAAQANARCARDDIEWAVSPAGGIYLRHRDSAMTQNTRDIERRREAERQIWLRNYHADNRQDDAA